MFNKKPAKPADKSRPVLTEDAVTTLVQTFLSNWPPFASRFNNYVGLAPRWADEGQGQRYWVVDLTPAIDVSCQVIVSDELAQVREARIVSMRTGHVQTEWRA
jgi:hypothetical protein